MDLVTIYVKGLPIGLADRASEHHDGLTRELTLIRQGHQQHPEGDRLPQRFLEFIDEIRSSYSSFGGEQTRQVDAARDAGESSVDLVYSVPKAIGPAIAKVADLLDEADEFCRRGEHLLALAAPPEVVAYRRWFLSQFVVQAAGGRPEPWTGGGHPAQP